MGKVKVDAVVHEIAEGGRLVVQFLLEGTRGTVDVRRVKVYRRPDGRYYMSGCFSVLEVSEAPLESEA